MMRGLVEFLNGNFDPAIHWLRRASERNPDLPTPYRFLAASWAHLGEIERAKSAWEKNLQAQPSFNVENYLHMARNMIKRQEEFDLYLEGLKRAGVDLGSFG